MIQTCREVGWLGQHRLGQGTCQHSVVNGTRKREKFIQMLTSDADNRAACFSDVCPYLYNRRGA